MKYELINTVNKSNSVIETIALNRGIKKEDIFHYFNTTDEDINSPLAFGEENMNSAATALIKTINREEDAILVVDCDCDGFTSAAILSNYLFKLFPTWTNNNLKFYIHEGKEHGLKDCIDECLKYSLVIAPDSSSGDYEEHKQLKEHNIPIIVLDHHEADFVSEDAIVINNQLSDYQNKQLSGAGVTWQFCRYLDSLTKNNYADEYLDLVALGLTADMMSMTSIETKHLIQKGFSQLYIKNPFIYGMAKKNSFSLGDKVTPMGAAFYIAPFVNAMVRSGTLEEKQLLFDSMLEYRAFEKILSNKRGHKLGELETVVEQALRTATNVKNRQTKAQEKGMEYLEHLIEENNMLNHKALIFCLEPGAVQSEIRGLVANKYMAKYQRPCCILTKVTDEDNIKSYQGSARGYDKSGITNFKDICAGFNDTMYVAGHQGAFGIGVPHDKVEQFQDYLDTALKDIDSEPKYMVDFIYEDAKDIEPLDIISISNLEDCYGKDFDEPYILIKAKITPDMVKIYRKKTNTLNIQITPLISAVKFRVTEEEYEKLIDNECTNIEIIGKCNKNEWGGNVNAQIIIEDYQIVGSNKYYF